MSIQYNTALDRLTAVDMFGVVHSIYDPIRHGTRAEWEAAVRAEAGE